MAKKQFKDFTATVKDADGDEQESTVKARVSDGDESVNTIAGVQSVNKGDVVIQRDDSPGTFDVLSADAWKETGYGKGSSLDPEPTPQESSKPTSTPLVKNGGGNK